MSDLKQNTIWVFLKGTYLLTSGPFVCGFWAERDGRMANKIGNSPVFEPNCSSPREVAGEEVPAST